MKSDRRKESRRALRLPVFVKGHDPGGAAWDEVAHSLEVTSGGASFVLHHPVVAGQVIHLSLPLPKALRHHDLTDVTYHVYALIRNVAPKPPCRVGVMFLGRTPPPGYLDGPATRYLLPTDQRQAPRYDLVINIRLVRSDRGTGAREELTVTENIGLGGARVPTSLPIVKGETVTVEEVKRAFRVRAEVLNVSVGRDNIPRLNLKFVDPEAASTMRQVLQHFGIHAEDA